MKIRLTKHWNDRTALCIYSSPKNWNSVIVYLPTSFQICINFFLLWNIMIFWRTLVTNCFIYLWLLSRMCQHILFFSTKESNLKTTQNHSKWFCQQSAIIYSPYLFICLFDFCTKIWKKHYFVFHRTTSGWVNDEIIYILAWTIHLLLKCTHLSTMPLSMVLKAASC